MFAGVACFSPGVAQSIRQLWRAFPTFRINYVSIYNSEEENGGTIATSVGDLESISYFFASVDDQYWITSLRSLSVPVYNETWVLDTLQKRRVAFPHHYTLSGGSQLKCTPSTEPRAEVTTSYSPSSNWTNEETLEGDEADSDLEVERTLVDDLKVHFAVVCQPIIPVRSLLAPFDPLLKVKSTELPEVSLVRIAGVAPVPSCVRFQSGEGVDGVTFQAKRKSPLRIH